MGVYNDDTLTFSQVAVTNNVGVATCVGCDSFGGGIYNDTNEILTMTGGSISGNTLRPTGSQTFGDGSTTASSKTFTSASANFSPSDVNGTITGTGIPAGTTISSWTSATSVQLSQNATATAIGVTFIFERGVGNVYGGGLYAEGTVTLSGVAVEGNTADTAEMPGSGYDAQGGGIYNDAALHAKNVTVKTNVLKGGSDYGGGLFNIDVAALDNATISGNTATGGSYVEGVGIDDQGGNQSGAPRQQSQINRMDVTNSVVSGNTGVATGSGSEAYGAGIYTDTTAGIIDNVKVTENSATADSYVEGTGIDVESHANITNTTVDNNHATIAQPGGSIDGGGVYLEDQSTMQSVSVSNNSAAAPGSKGEVDGGGIYSDDKLTMAKVKVLGNVATAGSTIQGAGLATYSSGIVINDSTFGNNSATTTADGSAIQGGASMSVVGAPLDDERHCQRQLGDRRRGGEHWSRGWLLV